MTEPDPRVDAVRGCVAFERGPLVYCVESADLPDGVELEDVELGSGRRAGAAPRPDLRDGVIGVAVPVIGAGGSDAALALGAIPYFAWANRGPAACGSGSRLVRRRRRRRSLRRPGRRGPGSGDRGRDRDGDGRRLGGRRGGGVADDERRLEDLEAGFARASGRGPARPPA